MLKRIIVYNNMKINFTLNTDDYNQLYHKRDDDGGNCIISNNFNGGLEYSKW